MKIFLEVEVRTLEGTEPDQRDAESLMRCIEKDFSGEYYHWRLTVDTCDDPGEQYNRGYDAGKYDEMMSQDAIG